MAIVFRFYPNGEFTQGVDTSRARKREHSEKPRKTILTYEGECKDGYLNWAALSSNSDIRLYTPGNRFKCSLRGGVYTYLCEDRDGHHFAYEGRGHVLADVIINEPIGLLIGKGELIPLVHQLGESSPTPSRKRLETMTNNMRRNIRQGVFLLEEMYGKDLLSFLTLTIPDLCAEDLAKVCERWDYMVDQILKWLRKRVEKYTMEFEYVYCTEIQSKRLQRRREYAPHLHIVFRGRNGRKAPWAVSPKMVRKAWANIIACVVGHRDFKSDALENIQRIKKSAARYLSKYLSKGNCCIPNSGNETALPSLKTQWGGMARFISRAIKSCTRYLRSDSQDGELAMCILREMDSLIKQGIVRYFRQGYIPINASDGHGMERVLKVGVGCLSSPTLNAGLEKAVSFISGL